MHTDKDKAHFRICCFFCFFVVMIDQTVVRHPPSSITPSSIAVNHLVIIAIIAHLAIIAIIFTAIIV
jgi:hypothetical protein